MAEKAKLTNVERRVLTVLTEHVRAPLTIEELLSHTGSHGGDVVDGQEMREACSSLNDRGDIQSSIDAGCIVRYWVP